MESLELERPRRSEEVGPQAEAPLRQQRPPSQRGRPMVYASKKQVRLSQQSVV